jgi:lipopolysaccharide biosynthesis regulator YciM
VNVEDFASEDDTVQHWLDLLKDGSRYQKIEARWGLSQIFERRGMNDEAIELLETNVAAGSRVPDLFERLAQLYRSRGETVKCLAAHAEAKRLRTAEARLPADLAAERRAVTNGISQGVLYIVAGLVVTVGSYYLASNAGGGHFIILYGPIIFGGYLLLRGLADVFPRNLGH